MNRILVVDDEPSIRKALAMGLESKDCEVDIAADGRTGINLGSRKSYDVLLVDLCLPDMDGLEVIKEIQQALPEIIPIMITGHGSLESSIGAIRLEVSDYIEKPLDLKFIKDAISRGFEKRDSKRQAMREKLRDMLKSVRNASADTGTGPQDNLLGEYNLSLPMLIHQINNPLMCIAGYAELVMDGLDLGDEESVRTYMKAILESTENITRINHEIMKMGKAKDNQDEVVELDLKAVLEDCLTMFNDLFYLNEITLEKDLPDHGLMVRGNRFDLEQIFKNLNLNAIDAMYSVSGKVLRISAGADMKEGTVFIRVQDTGCGIPPGSLEEIFKPYFTTKKHGTGLGMSVVKSVVKKHNGEIVVESREGVGTTFTVSLPAVSH